jgi:hypothetical protein
MYMQTHDLFHMFICITSGAIYLLACRRIWSILHGSVYQLVGHILLVGPDGRFDGM